MNPAEEREVVEAKIEKLREKATCRCDAINRKVNKGLPNEDNEPYYACGAD